jgi:hypothetical protein
MRMLSELAEISHIDDSFPADFLRRIAVERRLYTMPVVEIPEFSKLSVQITGRYCQLDDHIPLLSIIIGLKLSPQSLRWISLSKRNYPTRGLALLGNGTDSSSCRARHEDEYRF